MLRISFFVACFFLLNSLAFAQPAAAPATDSAQVNVDPNALPSMTDLQQMLDDKKYQAVILQTSRLLALQGTAADAYNRFDLLKMKAEAQLDRGDTESALSTFGQLGRETNDPHEKDVAQATRLLIHRSPGGKYVPKTLPAGVDKLQPIDIRDPLTRKAALEAMFDDDWQAIEPQLKTAADAKSIPPILPAIDAITRLRPLDVAAAGTDQRTSESAAKLVDHAKKLMTAALDQMKKRIDDISDAANTESVSTQTIFMQGIASQVQTRTKQGLTDRNIRELRDMISTCQKITPAAQTLANAGTKVDIQDVLSESDEVQSKAKDLLDTRF